MTTLPLALIVEDNEDQNLVFMQALVQAGYATETVVDGPKAQRRLTEIVPFLILLDLHVPGVNGAVLLQQIRSDRRLAQARVILTTADAVFADTLRAQADLVLLKPISFVQLQQLASRFLGRTKPISAQPDDPSD
jgi:CheY-like chemotaxis protein